MFKYIFGPVPSRRLGISLGVDLVTPKTCNLNCIYCESGKTTDHRSETRSFFNKNELFTELQKYFENETVLDYITFSGAGEPLLNRDFKDILQFLKSITDTPLALITNGTLLKNQEIREAAMGVDLIMPSLDCATQSCFEKLNQPCSGVLVEDHVRGLLEFSKEFNGSIWIEVFFASGINDSLEERTAIYDILKEMKPDKVQLNTLDRPAAFHGVLPVGIDFLENLVEEWKGLKVEVIKKIRDRSEISSFNLDLENSILNTISRRPLRISDLIDLTGASDEELCKYLDILEKEGKVKKKILENDIFYLNGEDNGHA